MRTNRAGSFITQPSGFTTFLPSPLPPNPPVVIDSEMLALLSEADRMLGRLDGITEILPNPDFFVSMYVYKEAVLSSQIEGTQASLSDVLSNTGKQEKKEDIHEVVNYVAALDYGLKRLETLPLSLRLLREIHAQLLRTGRGSHSNPGEFRKTQNWIGAPGCTLKDATFIPPTVPDMESALGDLERFLYEEDTLPPLIKIALVHAQFESIHPFLDGNGRMGRLLITFWLCHQKVLNQPLLYLSYYFKKYRLDYYDHLMEVRLNGNWEKWIKFFLKGVIEVSEEATKAAKEIILLKQDCESRIGDKKNANYLTLLDYLFEKPFITITEVEEKLAVSYPTAKKLVDSLVEAKILYDGTPLKQRNKQYVFAEYLSILERGTELNTSY